MLGLLALFTRIHAFWVAGLLLALIDIPNFGWPLRRIAGSLEKIADIPPGRGCRPRARWSCGGSCSEWGHGRSAEDRHSLPHAKEAPIIRLDSSTQEAAAEAATIDVLAAEGKIREVRRAHQQAKMRFREFFNSVDPQQTFQWSA